MQNTHFARSAIVIEIIPVGGGLTQTFGLLTQRCNQLLLVCMQQHGGVCWVTFNILIEIAENITKCCIAFGVALKNVPKIKLLIEIASGPISAALEARFERSSK